MDYSKLTIPQYINALKAKQFTAGKACEFFAKRCLADKKGAILEVFDSWKILARNVDDKIKRGEPLGKLAGVPIIIKDNILYKNHRAGASSKILDGFIAPYSATVVEKIIAEDGIIIARSDMDEFAMGGVGRYAYNGPTKNAHSDDHHAGGSSSGSAVAVALGYCLVALGSDTAGSVRYPASLNGIVGIKPTYGSVSRYGAVAFGSNLEQVGVFARNIHDTQILLNVISGKCPMDATSLTPPSTKPLDKVNFKGLKIGKIKELYDALSSSPFAPLYEKILGDLKSRGARIIEISTPNITKSINTYYALAPTQAASNLARFDGVRYGYSDPEAETLNELYEKTRSAGFGTEVKRRILLGNLMLSARPETNEAGIETITAMKERIATEFTNAFKSVDILLMPTGYGVAPKIGVAVDPVDDYLVDLFTVPANMSGSPALSIPCGIDEIEGSKLPLGLQIVADKWNEDLLFAVAKELEEVLR